MPEQLAFGVLGAAGIANKVVAAINATETAKVVAIGSRTLEKAQAFASKHNIPNAYDSYDTVLDSSEVQAVYIPLVTTIKKEWALKAIAKGKHVLVEKPYASAADVDAIRAAAAAANLQFMDGTMFVHHARFFDDNEFKSLWQGSDTATGPITRINSAFSFPVVGDNIRIRKDTEPLGSLGDLGWYNVKVSLWAVNYKLPTHVVASTWTLNDEKVVTDISATLIWDDGRSATFDASFKTVVRQWVEVCGLKASAIIDDFVLTWNAAGLGIFPDIPFGKEAPYTTKFFDGQTKTHTPPACIQEQVMIDHFVEGALAGGNTRWADEAHKTQLVIDAIQKSVDENGARIAL